MQFSPVRLPLLIAIVGLGACHRSAPEVAPSVTASATIEVLKGGRWLFTYAEPAGTFATTDKPETVPAEARGLVRVLDPSEPMSMSAKNAGDRVYVTNLNELTSKGKSSARAMSREAFETAALAGLPSGQSSPFAAQRGPAPTLAPPAAGATGPGGATTGQAASGAPASGATPVVTIYGTSWCGACRAAREFLTERKIPFADKDVERDPDAARELAAKASKMGIPTDRVPIIDVRGRLLLGFDRARIEALLGQPT
jgi:glutaredoxin